eukprot:m.106680 g.106680  ORF g.106680 m.106680 type:complete len:299 (-) comp15819_c1_seq2:1038-1934(-)
MASQQHDGVWPRLRHFIAGYFSGCALVLAGHPFDTIKVRLQTEQTGRFKGPLDCLTQTVRREGLRAIYKGVTPPLLATGVVNSIMFGMQGMFSQKVAKYRRGEAATPEVSDIAIAALGSGFCISFLVSPMEGVKARLQVNYAAHGEAAKYKGPIDCIKQTIREEGVSRGLFRGVTATLAREVPGNAAWFGVYENLCRKMTPVGGTRADLKPHQQMLAGGLSGMAYWTAFYPADTVKSQMQTNPQMAGKSFLTILNKIYTEQGFRALYKGWGITVSRALPSNAVLFFVYEVTSGLLNRI